MKTRIDLKTVLSIIFCVLILVFALTDFFYILKYTEANPVIAPSMTPTPELGADGFDPEKAVNIKKLSATADTITVEFDKVTGAAKYLVSFRTGDEDWLSEYCETTSLTISVEPKTQYEVKVCAVSSSDVKGLESKTGTVTTVPETVAVSLSSDDVSSIMVSWDDVFEKASYTLAYREAGSLEWTNIALEKTEYTVTGLKKDVSYEFRVIAKSSKNEELASVIKTGSTLTTGFLDPFAGVNGVLQVNGKKKTVPITSADGCLGAICWAAYKSSVCSDAEMNAVITNLSEGTKLTITKDDNGHYVYCGANNHWAVHVTGTNFTGWVEGCALIVDLQDICRAENNIYSIQYNRTNAYASIYTCGGNAKKTDNSSSQKSRYAMLNAASGTIALTMGNYNYIKDITGSKLANYGPKNQMPVVWDMALELITCQRNALLQGYSLLIYEGYSPSSAAKKMYDIVNEEGYLTYLQNNMNLANGFLNAGLSIDSYIPLVSGHNKAAAVDITLMKFSSVDSLGAEVSMQTKVHTLDFRSNMRYNTKDANTLKTIMTTDTGLVPLKNKQEWWHFELDNDTDRYPGINKYVFGDYSI